jgi:hypothetical protein
MDLVERVAWAIAANAIGADVWDGMASTQRGMFRAQAQAAIEATGVRELVEALRDLLEWDGRGGEYINVITPADRAREALAKHGTDA